MNVNIRECQENDASPCGEICFTAFKTIADNHNFPPDFPSAEVATGMLSGLIKHPRFYGIVAELDGDIIGSNFLDERSTIAGLGPITVSPGIQSKAVGKELMLNVLDRARAKNFPGVRLLQVAFNNGSLSLYSKLGFNVQGSFAVMQGVPIPHKALGYTVRTACEEDLDSCNALCVHVHGHDRAGELSDAFKLGTATVAEHGHRIVGYSTGLAFFGHSVAESNDGLKALISSASEFQGPGILVPTTNHELFRWCLQNNMRVVQVMNLMTMGLYNHPNGSYLASVLY